MTPVDFLKALGLAVLVLALDMVTAFTAVFVWSLAAAPTTPVTPTSPEVIAISTMSTGIAGPLLFALAVWIGSRRRPARSPFAFAAVAFGFYLLIDWAMVAFQGMLTPTALAIMALKFAGAMAGAWLARRGQTA